VPHSISTFIPAKRLPTPIRSLDSFSELLIRA
jgi:hypothetical protein